VKLTEFAVRLREKQKVRRIYGVLERQFRRYFGEANRKKGRTGEEMISLLERRLDSIVHRMGFGVTRAAARQLIKHNHVLVNGKRLNIPSYIVENGDKIEVREPSRKIPDLLASIASADKRPVVTWIEADRANFAGTVKNAPVREELNEPAIREQYVVEYYSR
jgi:small subunit ribosomal protein S4